MLMFGQCYRILASYYSRPSDSTPIPKGTLSKIPLQINEWSGHNVPLDPRIIEKTDADDFINRIYTRRQGNESVSIVNLRDLMPHRPEVCYPSAGWTLSDSQLLNLPISENLKLPCQIHRFKRGALELKNITVLNYYIVDDQYCHDVSLLRSKSWHRNSDKQYSLQVQIAGTPNLLIASEEKAVLAFAAASALHIRNLIIHATHGDSQSPSIFNETKNE